MSKQANWILSHSILLVLACVISSCLGDYFGKPPEAFSLSTPADKATEVSLTPNLVWSVAREPTGWGSGGSGATVYDVGLKKSAEPDTTWIAQGISAINFQIVAPLAPNTEYEWVVEARNSSLTGGTRAGPFTFTTTTTTTTVSQ